MREIGGYFEIELNTGAEYHTNAIRLNLGRNAFFYVLKVKKYKKVYLPYYTCDVMLQPICLQGVSYEFYHINEYFEPLFDFDLLQDDEAFVYTNYFGLKDYYIESLARVCKNLIIDNSQAFFSKPIPNVDTFYSARKFFGVPDGAYLYTNKFIDEPLKQDKSYSRFEHLLKRIDNSAEDAYSKFIENDKNLNDVPLMSMSSLTIRLLKNIDYKEVIRKRISNFNILNQSLSSLNQLKVELGDGQVPMVYPFYAKNEELRQELIKRRIYVAQYWPNVLHWVKPDSIEYSFSANIVHLPLDQRYDSFDMGEVVKQINGIL